MSRFDRSSKRGRRIVGAVTVAAMIAVAVATSTSVGAATALDVRFGPGQANQGVDGWAQTLPPQCYVRDGVPMCRAEGRWINGGWQFTNSVWTADVPDGDYTLTVEWGDPVTDHLNRVVVNGQVVVDGRANRQVNVTTTEVTVSGGLRITFGPDSSYRTALSRLVLSQPDRPTTTTAPSSTTTEVSIVPPTLPPTTESTTTTTTMPPTPGPTVHTFDAGVHEIDEPIVLRDRDVVVGAGTGATVLVPGPDFPAGAALIRTESDSGVGTGDFSIAELTVDCDRRCAGIRVHGYRYHLDDVRIVAADGTAFHSSWEVGGFTTVPGDRPAMEAFIDDLVIEQSGSATDPAMIFAGPHDSSISGLYVGHDVSANPPFLVPEAIRFAPGGEGTTVHDLHTWGRSHERGVVVEQGVSGLRLHDAYLEGARFEQLWWQGDNTDSTVTAARVQCFVEHGPNATGVRYSGGDTGHRFDGRIIGCVMGGLVLDPGAGGWSSFDLTTWQSPTIGTLPTTGSLSELTAP